MVIMLGLPASAGAETRTLAVTGTGANREAATVVILTNRGATDAPVVASYVGDDSTRAASDNPSQTGLGLIVAPSTLPAGQPTQVRVRFLLGATGTLAGSLLVRGGADAVSIDVKTAAEPDVPNKVAPSSVTLTLTSYCPKVLCDQTASDTVTLTGPGMEEATQQRLSGPGRSFEVSAAPTGTPDTKGPGPADDRSEVTITAALPSKAGQYSDPIDVGSGTPPAKVSVTVRVQHWFLYPFLAVLVGSLMGAGLLSPSLSIWSRRRRLRIAIVDPTKAYLDRRGGLLGGVYPLEDWFGPLNGRAPKLPAKGITDNALLGVEKLYAKTYSASSDADFDAVSAQIKELRTAVEQWAAVAAELATLKADAQAVPGGGGGPADEARQLLDGGARPQPSDPKEYLAKLRRLGALFAPYAAARKRWFERDESWRTDHADENPATIYGTAKKALERDEGEDTTLRDALDASSRDAPQIATAGQPGKIETTAAPGGSFSLKTLTQSVRARRRRRRAQDSQSLAKLRRSLVRRVSLVEWGLWGVGLTASAVGVAVSLWAGKAFGADWTDYGTAFLFGLLGGAISGGASWAILPKVRGSLTQVG
jgi:hypothetical protein